MFRSTSLRNTKPSSSDTLRGSRCQPTRTPSAPSRRRSWPPGPRFPSHTSNVPAEDAAIPAMPRWGFLELVTDQRPDAEASKSARSLQAGFRQGPNGHWLLGKAPLARLGRGLLSNQKPGVSGSSLVSSTSGSADAAPEIGLTGGLAGLRNPSSACAECPVEALLVWPGNPGAFCRYLVTLTPYPSPAGTRPSDPRGSSGRGPFLFDALKLRLQRGLLGVARRRSGPLVGQVSNGVNTSRPG